MGYKFLSAVLIAALFVCGAKAQSFGNPDISIEKIFPPFSVKNADSTMALIDVFRVTDKEFNAFADSFAPKAAGAANGNGGAFVVFNDKRSKSKGVGEEELFHYAFMKQGKDILMVTATGKRTVNNDLQISGSVAISGDTNESIIAQFLPPINAPRLNISVRKDFKNANLTKECGEYINTLKNKHGFDMPKEFKALKEAYNTLKDDKRKEEMERLLNSMAVKYAGDFEYTAECKIEGGTSIIGLNIKRRKFSD
ncbi:MAG: hypothetical protein LBB59_04120 [Campylobacteraceae bacterium]|jgi:hypothetical protein|nr:hypothetical protein [Campylobacteraceae bacterium]